MDIYGHGVKCFPSG